LSSGLLVFWSAGLAVWKKAVEAVKALKGVDREKSCSQEERCRRVRGYNGFRGLKEKQRN